MGLKYTFILVPTYFKTHICFFHKVLFPTDFLEHLSIHMNSKFSDQDKFTLISFSTKFLSVLSLFYASQMTHAEKVRML